jgi:hypothetical protein
MKIRALRILPPLAIARLGSSPQPLDNYDVCVSDRDPLEYREIRGALTFVVDRDSGTIRRAYTPESVRFRDELGRVKPVAPFLEAWADVGGTLVPLTRQLLAEAGLALGDVEWRAQVGNHKAFRRTGMAADRIDAATEWFGDHGVTALEGRCANFLRGKTLPFGDVQFIRPTKEFPEIRLRFTPAMGLIYGGNDSRTRPEDVADVVYDTGRGTWSGYTDDNANPSAIVTNPGGIYGNVGDSRTTSRGYLDDECDGIVEVRIRNTKLAAFARIGAGPPDYAPDSFPVRTIADELEQMLLGPDITDEEASPEWTEEILRRAFETVRLQNTVVLNGNPVLNGEAANCMASQDTDSGRVEAPIMAPALVDSLALRALHQSVFTALRSGTAAWFGQVLREFDKVGDLTDAGRRKMPAMMRGSDGMHLALTRRQRNAILASGNRKATADDPEAVTFTMPTTPPSDEEPR